MGSDDEDALLKHFYQTNQFSLEDENTSNTEKADKLRELIFFLDRMVTVDKVTEESHDALHRKFSTQYHGLVDNMDKSRGLDNYSEMVSVLTEGKKNESKHWVSGLSLDDDDMPASVRKVLEKGGSQEARKMKITRKKDQGADLNLQKVDNVNDRFASNGVIPPLQESQQQNHQTHTNQHPSNAPRFGKRKQTFHEDNDHCEKKVNTILYKKKDIPTVNQEEKNNILYRRKNGETKNDRNNAEEEEEDSPRNPFLTAHQQLRIDMKKPGNNKPTLSYGQTKKSLGAKRGGIGGAFVPPIGGQGSKEENKKKKSYGDDKDSKSEFESKYEEFEWMKNVDPKMIEHVENEIMDQGEKITWDDIAGLEFAKSTIQEIVIWPMLRPDLFTGLRGPPKGLLLFGPPGTGKTLIGKCIASQSNAKFFNISASSLTSKWIGDGEKMVRALFGVARCVQPAVIFIDEIDSLLTQRSDSEHESSRRLKTEFLVQLDGATALLHDRILVVGATNRPQELDEAARRRLVKRLYIPLPDSKARQHIVNNLMKDQHNDLSQEDIEHIVEKSEGFSGADMANLCRDAALGPIRGLPNIQNISASDVRPVNMADFLTALVHVRPSVSQNDLQGYVEWNRTYGSGGA